MLVPRVIRADEVTDDTPQTPNMIRRVAIDAKMTGATRIFLGPAGGGPGPKRSPPHHHGEAETAVYYLSGRQRVYYGENFTEFIECRAGDFAYIPPWLPHIEANEWEEPCLTILARSPSNIVVNLDDEWPTPR